MNTYDECLKAVAGVLLTHCGTPAEQVQPEAELQADLGLDSVGLLSLALELENHFQIYLGEDTENPPQTVDDVVKLLVVRLEEVRDAS